MESPKETCVKANVGGIFLGESYLFLIKFSIFRNCDGRLDLTWIDNYHSPRKVLGGP